MDCRIELVILPVSDVDRAIEFYVDKAGFHLDMQARVNENLRFVQVTPPTSACSIAFGEGVSDMAPDAQRGIQVVVEDVELARRQLVEGGVDASEVEHLAWGSFIHFADPTATPGRSSSSRPGTRPGPVRRERPARAQGSSRAV